MRGLRLLAVAWVLAPLLAVAAQVAVPELRSPVTDLTGTLTADQAAALEQKLRAFEARKGSQVAVLLVPTTAPETIEQYSIRVAEQWRVGRGQVDDGVILLVAKDDRAVRIEVGYGVEGAIPDVLANRIVEQVIVPRFRQGQFAEGIDAGVDRIIALLDGEPLPTVEQGVEPQRGRSSQGQGIGTLLPLLLMFVFVGSGMVRRVLGGLGGASLMGGIAAVIAWALTSAVAIAAGAAIIAFLFTLLGGGGGGGFGGGMGGWTRGRRGGFGGGWGGGGGFGGGGGGWSGGGGGFGGGGASGRW